MAIVGIASIAYGVSEIERSAKFFDDFGLVRAPEDDPAAGFVRYRLSEGSGVELRPRSDALFKGSRVADDGVHSVIWGVDSQASFNRLVDGLSHDHEITQDLDGTVRFLTPFGILMGLRVFARTAVVTAPDPLNSPGRINRLNQHRKWRERALPKVIGHVVWALPDYQAGYEYMRDRLNFRLSDHQRGVGMYLRAEGSNNHHNIFFLNANAPMPGADGNVRFHHTNFGVEDIDEIMTGANLMVRRGWGDSHLGLGRHRIDSALFYYLPCPAGGEAEYGADADYIDDGWVPRFWVNPSFGFAHYTHNLPPFLLEAPSWDFRYLTEEAAQTDGGHR